PSRPRLERFSPHPRRPAAGFASRLENLRAMGRTQKVMADALAQEYHLPTRTARRLVERFVHMLGEDLVETGRVELRGFGVFALEDRPAHTVKHPKTGKPVRVAEKHEVRFRASVAIRRKLNPAAKPKKPPAQAKTT